MDQTVGQPGLCRTGSAARYPTPAASGLIFLREKIMTGDLSLSEKSDILLLIEDGKDFLDYLRGFSARQGTVSHAEFRTERKELEAAEIANRIANALTTIDDNVRSKLPRYICDELNVADGVLHRLADRWGWDQVIGAGGDEFICRCIKEREAINRQYHAKMEEAGIRAVVSYVQLSKERPDISLLDRAGSAMIVGTKPTMSLGEAEDSMADLKKALESPCGSERVRGTHLGAK
jgi:hypothetical protein